MGYNVQSNSQCYQFPKEGKSSKIWMTQLEVNGPTNFAFIYKSLWAYRRKYEGALQGYILYGVLNVWKFHQVYAYNLHKLFCWYIIWKCQLKFVWHLLVWEEKTQVQENSDILLWDTTEEYLKRKSQFRIVNQLGSHSQACYLF